MEYGRELGTDFTACLYFKVNVNEDLDRAREETVRYPDTYYDPAPAPPQRAARQRNPPRGAAMRLLFTLRGIPILDEAQLAEEAARAGFRALRTLPVPSNSLSCSGAGMLLAERL